MPEPLEVDGVVDDPCTALAADQLSGLDISGAGKADTFSGDPICTWRMTTGTMHVVTIRPRVSDEGGLSRTYRMKDDLAYFEPTEIGDYPAVFASMLDERDKGGCDLEVGATDDLVITVDTTFLDRDPCPVAERVAEVMVRNLAEGS